MPGSQCSLTKGTKSILVLWMPQSYTVNYLHASTASRLPVACRSARTLQPKPVRSEAGKCDQDEEGKREAEQLVR